MNRMTIAGCAGLIGLASAAALASPHESGRTAYERYAATTSKRLPVRNPQPKAPKAEAHEAHGPPHWGYEGAEGPAFWSNLSPEYRICALGKNQSPIDLAGANTTANVAVSADYRPGPLVILNNGHTVQDNVPPGSIFMSGSQRYTLLQVHFHTPSEHTLNGRAYPMEAHFVHKDEKGNLAVLGIFFEVGATNAELAKLIVAAPRQKADSHVVEGFTFDPARLLPPELAVYRYQGSLTTPGCSEGVAWHVAQTPVQASATQIHALQAIMGHNARPPQPVNGRLVIAPGS